MASRKEIGAINSAHQALKSPNKVNNELVTEANDNMKERINPMDALYKFKRLLIAANTPDKTTAIAIIKGASSGTTR